MKLIKSLVLSVLFLSVIFIAGCNEAPITSDENIEGGQLSKAVTSIELHIYNTSANGQTINIYAVASDWEECVVTYNTAPTLHSGPEGSFETNVANGWITTDISVIFNKWLDGTYDNFGILLSSSGTNLERFDSKEGANPPFIRVTFDDGSYEDIADIADTELNELDPDGNFCSDVYLFNGIVNGYEKLALIKFDTPLLTENCETAYAFGGSIATCFLQLSPISANNWGWTNLIGPGYSGTWPMYAGAGQCDISKGTHVGNVAVTYIGGTITVDYQLFAGYSLDETHVWIGADKLPKKNGIYQTAPGKFNYNGADPVVLTGQTGNKYVAVHAGVCWFE